MPTDRTFEPVLVAQAPQIAARPLRRFLVGLLAISALMAAFVGLSLAVLYQNRENVSPVEAARLQNESGGLYGSALVYRPYPYKLELYRLQNPDVAIVGSSRAMAFVAEGFAGSMTNLGGAVNEIVDAERLIPDMLAAHRPKLLLITLDFWWFNQSRVEDPAVISQAPDIKFGLNDILTPAQWILDGDVKPGALLRSLFPAPADEPLIGVWAHLNHSGFDRRGTRFYGGLLTGEVPADDPGFKRTLKRVKNAKADSKLAIAGPFSESAWQALLKTADAARAQQVEVRFIVPPVAPQVQEEMRAAAPRTLIDELHAHLEKSDYAYDDFSDPKSLDSGACEFVDGLHGGFVTYLRILRQVAAGLEARPELRGLIQPDAALASLIESNAGRATLRGQKWAGTESDFLKLGCDKS